MKIISLSPTSKLEVIKQVANTLTRGGMVVFPSDTVYGLAVNARNPEAVKKLYAFKNRPLNQSVSIAVPSLTIAQNYVRINADQQKLLASLLPGPYTIVLPATHQAIAELEAEDQTLGIRIPDNSFVHTLSQTVDFPFTATSANLHGKGPHHSITALLNTLSSRKQHLIDLIVDAGTLPPNPPSTVINLATPTPTVLRQGTANLELVTEFASNSAEATKVFAHQWLQKLLPSLKQQPLVLILQGDLGAGKTVFSQGVGSSLGITRVVSPTYVIYYEYSQGDYRLHHFDLYRLEHDTDLSLFNLPSLLKPNNVLVFEWGERLASVLPQLRQHMAQLFLVQFTDQGSDSRQLKVYRL